MQITEEVEIRHYHGFCGLGGGARGFNRGEARVANLVAKFRCIGGFDVSPAAVRDFERLAGTPGTVLDLFDREQYIAFHGCEPPTGWREATPEDIRRSAGNERPHIVFLSAPCKGFSGLLSESRSKSEKYQALNRLTLRGIWLMLEAWADDPPELIIFENVPRIMTRGRALLDRIGQLLRHYGYAVAETTHDCGEIGELAQSRKRFLLVARHTERVRPFLYEPPKRPLRAVGEVLGRLPLPGDPIGGPMHSLPRLHWKTWVRLAFVEAGSDWRSLNRLRVVDGKLADYLIVPEYYGDVLGVNPWTEPCGAVSGRGGATNGAYSVADPRIDRTVYSGHGVTPWQKPANTIAGESFPSNGNFAVADPRFDGSLGVREWDEPTGVVTSQHSPGQGAFSVADPRPASFSSQTRQNIYRVVSFGDSSKTITGASHSAGGALSVADPRPPAGPVFGKYAVADPRPSGVYNGKGKYLVVPFDSASNTVIAQSTTGHGAFAVADPRLAMQRGKGDDYLTAGHYGVVPWVDPCGAVSAAAGCDNGRWSVADPRMPADNEKLVAVIRSLDGTWHRPFTTLELAALQSLIDPDDIFDLDGDSDSAKRERIGNAVPPAAAKAIADMMGQTLLLEWSGQSFQLSAQPIWVRPVAVALSVKTPLDQEGR